MLVKLSSILSICGNKSSEYFGSGRPLIKAKRETLDWGSKKGGKGDECNNGYFPD